MTQDRPSYWEIREMILEAIRMNQDSEIVRLAKLYPGIFQQMVAQVKNANIRQRQWKQTH